VLEKQGDNLLTIKDGEAADEIDPDRIAVKQGALEASNVQVVHEMVSMIDHHRMYESFQKMMWTFDEIDGKAITEVGKPQ
jgi:flagellar basal-body rod protein FlgG